MTLKGKGAKVVEYVEKKVGDAPPVVLHDKNEEVIVPVPTEQNAVVNVNLGGKRGLPNYSSLSVGVSLTLPCHVEAVDQTYEKAKAWCFKRVDELFAEAMEE